jgi:hypothetical protein
MRGRPQTRPAWRCVASAGVLIVSLVGCSSGPAKPGQVNSDGSGVRPSPSTSLPTPTGGQAVTLPQSTWSPSPSASYMGARIQGTLRLQVNHCVRLEEPGGQMTTILWPRGYTAARAGSEVKILAPDGTEVARTGSSFSGLGGYIDVGAGTQPCAVDGSVFELNQDLTHK